MSFGPTDEEKSWAARKERLFAVMGGSGEDRHFASNEGPIALCPCGTAIRQTTAPRHLHRYELELELVQPHMTQKPGRRGEVDVRVSQVYDAGQISVFLDFPWFA